MTEAFNILFFSSIKACSFLPYYQELHGNTRETTIRKPFKFQLTVRLINHGNLTLLQMHSINFFRQSFKKNILHKDIDKILHFMWGERGGINN